MIKFSKKSWHYKLATLLKVETENTSLCKYFWSIVIKSILKLAVSIALLIIYSMPLWKGDRWSWIPWIATGGLISMLVVIGYISKSINWLRKRKLKRKEPDLLKEWIRAKKEKVCPFIKFED